VIIPGTGFNKNRDKLFFFWSQEYLPRLYPTRIRDLTQFGYTSVLFPGLDAAQDDD